MSTSKNTFEKDVKALEAFKTELPQGGTRAAMNGAAAKSRDLWMLDIDQILVMPGFNPRIHNKRYEEHLDSIADSMVQSGYLLSKPMEVFVTSDNKIYVTDGHTRHAAYKRALERGLERGPVPVVPLDKGTSFEDLTIGLVRSNSGAELTAYETSIVVKRLSTVYHRAPSDIASALGITEKYVGQLLTLASAPIEVREMVQEGEISASLAIDMLAKHKENTVAVLQAAAGKAAGEGKKATKKDTLTPEELKKKREKKLATRLFTAVELLLADKKVIECIDPEVYKEIDTILFERDAA